MQVNYRHFFFKIYILDTCKHIIYQLIFLEYTLGGRPYIAVTAFSQIPFGELRRFELHRAFKKI